MHNKPFARGAGKPAASTLISKDMHNFFIESYLARKAASTPIFRGIYNP